MTSLRVGTADLSEQRVVVIGGSSGIGLAVAQACAVAGAAVTIVGRGHDRIDAALASFEGADIVDGAVADASDESQIGRLFQGVGAVDHVVVTAAAPQYARVRELDLADARRTLDSKVLAALHVAKHADIDPHGSLVLTAGIASDRPAFGGAVVAAANGALVALTRAFALELAPVRVNAVAPGWVDTPLWTTMAGDAKDQRLAEQAERLPVRRVGTPADIADAVLFLLGNDFTTGETLHVDGGHRLV